MQIMNHFIQFHILFGQRSTQAGMLRVKKLDYQSPSNHRTHKKLHVGQLVIWKTLLELQSGGVFSEAVNSEMEHQSFPK